MNDCIFCKIINNELPANKVYEDESFVSFLTIAPVSEGHVLIIPKEHIVWMQDAPDVMVGEIFKVTKKLMKAIQSSQQCDYAEVVVAGEEIPHFHVHVIPRMLKDNLPKFPTKKYQEGEAEKIAQKIIAAL